MGNECCIKVYLQQPLISHVLRNISNPPPVNGLQALSKMNGDLSATRTSRSVFEYFYRIVCARGFLVVGCYDSDDFRFLHIFLDLNLENTPVFVPPRKRPDAGISRPITKQFFSVSGHFLSVPRPKTNERRRARSRDHGSLSGKSALERPLLFLSKVKTSRSQSNLRNCLKSP